MVGKITTEDCLTKIQEWIFEHATQEEIDIRLLSRITVPTDWKRRSKKVVNGATVRRFENLNTGHGSITLDVIESAHGFLTVCVCDEHQPSAFMGLIAIKKKPEPEIDRGQDFGSW